MLPGSAGHLALGQAVRMERTRAFAHLVSASLTVLHGNARLDKKESHLPSPSLSEEQGSGKPLVLDGRLPGLAYQLQDN